MAAPQSGPTPEPDMTRRAEHAGASESTPPGAEGGGASKLLQTLVREIAELKSDNETLRWRLDSLTERFAEVLAGLRGAEGRTGDLETRFQALERAFEALVAAQEAASIPVDTSRAEHLLAEMSVITHEQHVSPGVIDSLMKELENVRAPRRPIAPDHTFEVPQGGFEVPFAAALAGPRTSAAPGPAQEEPPAPGAAASTAAAPVSEPAEATPPSDPDPFYTPPPVRPEHPAQAAPQHYGPHNPGPWGWGYPPPSPWYPPPPQWYAPYPMAGPAYPAPGYAPGPQPPAQAWGPPPPGYGYYPPPPQWGSAAWAHGPPPGYPPPGYGPPPPGYHAPPAPYPPPGQTED